MSLLLPRRDAMASLLAAGALALATGCGPGGPASGAPGATGGASAAKGISGTLVFGSDGNITTLDLVTRARKQLTKVQSGAFARDPLWSGAGAEIIYAYSPPLPAVRGPGGLLPLPVTDLYVIDPSGGDGKPLVEHDAPGAGYESPVLTPDGKAILVTYTALVAENNIVRDQITEVARIPRSGGTRQTLVHNAMFPAISADGQRLAFVVNATNGQGIGLAEGDGKNPRVVLPPGQLDGIAGLRFSPDGKQVIFAAYAPPLPVATVTPLAGPAPAPAPGRTSFLGVPRALAHGLPMDIFSIPVDGTAAHRLTQLGEDSPSVAWSPDGKRLAIVAGGGIYVMFGDGSGFESLDPKGGHGSADWKK